MVYSVHQHEYAYYSEAIAHIPCKQDQISIYRCNDCYVQKEVMTKFKHTYQGNVTESSCLEQGYTTYTCVCGDNYISDYKDALGHKYGEWFIATSPSQSSPGMLNCVCANDSEKNHVKTHVLPLLSVENGYSYDITKSPTCTDSGTGVYALIYAEQEFTFAVTIEAKGHRYGEWAQTVAPGCETKGEERRDCVDCDYYETKEIEALGYLLEFIYAVENLSRDQAAEVSYNELYSVLQLYAKLTEEEKQKAGDVILILDEAVELYNMQATTVNCELITATELAFVPLSAHFAFLAALYLVLKKFFVLK